MDAENVTSYYLNREGESNHSLVINMGLASSSIWPFK